MKKSGLSLLTVLTLLGVDVSARAGTYTFNFNSATSGPSLSEGAGDAAIKAYMDAVLLADGCTGCSVTVTGAVADHTYNGENNVVGPGGVSDTLGNTEGATSNSAAAVTNRNDNFLANTNDSSTQISNEITMVFTGLSVYSVSFDYEIFPDGSCPSLSSCGTGDSNLPDFEFTTGSGAGTPVFTTYGSVPSSTDAYGDGSSTKYGATTIYSPQYIGVSGTRAVGSGSGVKELNFVDWPATIGIDNLVITTDPSVPEPASVFLLGTACAGVLLSLRRRFKQPS